MTPYIQGDAVVLRALIAGLAVGLSVAAAAQDSTQPLSGLSALQTGPVTVWVVTPGNDAERGRAEFLLAQKRAAKYARPPGYTEATAGSFGKSASDAGQNAGSYGQTASTLGKNASDAGTNAGNYGKSTTDPSISVADSTQASNYGQTAGSFGQPSSTFGQRINGEPVGPTPSNGRQYVIHNTERERLASRIASSLRIDLQAPESVRVISVASEELALRMQEVDGTANYPDVLLSSAAHPLGANSGAEITMLGWPGLLDGGDAAPALEQGHTGPPDWNFMWPTILAKAPHPARARAFVVWAREVAQCPSCGGSDRPELAVPGGIAQGAVASVLAGGGLGPSADPTAAKFSAALAQKLALRGDPNSDVGGLEYRVEMDARRSVLFDRLALIAVRTIASGDRAFGVTHSLVVLRKNDAGQWKVLQVSANQGWGRRSGDGTAWTVVKSGATGETNTGVPAGVRLAAPVDGDVRPVTPQLWWDNLGGAALQVVEWQLQTADDTPWTDTRLMLVPDHDFRVQTQATATFAVSPGTYRWRVWSVARGGAVKLSEWRTLQIIR